MQLFRRAIAVLLMISLPVYGWAFSAMPTCSMQSGPMGDATAAAAHGGHALDSHCCADQQPGHGSKASDHGDSQCQCSVMYQAVQPLTALIIPIAHSSIQSSPFHSITTVALPLWRPPTVS